MGKGDQRTRRGKIFRGTFGKRRPKKRRVATKSDATTDSTPGDKTTGKAARQAGKPRSPALV